MDDQLLSVLMGMDAPTIVVIVLLYSINKSSERSYTLLLKILEQLRQTKK